MLVGRTGAGKTSLRHALAAAVDTGHHSPPRPAPPTIELELQALQHRGLRLSLLDTPGEPELVAARVAGLRGADAALFVVPAIGGVDPATARMWQSCVAQGMPRAVAVTGLDVAGADLGEALALCERLFGEPVPALTVPVYDDESGAVGGVLDLLDLTLRRPGFGAVPEPAAPEHVELVAGLRQDLVELVLAECDDPALLDRYLADMLDGSEPAVRVGLYDAVGRGTLAPALALDVRSGAGLAALLDLLAAAFPAPQRSPCPPAFLPDGAPAAPLEADPDGPLVAEVLRGGERALLRVWSGNVDPARDGDWPGPAAVAGELLEVTALLDTGRSLGNDLRLADWELPVPCLPVGVSAPLPAVAALLRRDPGLQAEQLSPTGPLLLWCQGPEHARRSLAALGLTEAPPPFVPDEVDVALQLQLPATAVRAVTRALQRGGAHVRPDPDAIPVLDGDAALIVDTSLRALAAGLAVSAQHAVAGTLRWTGRRSRPTDAADQSCDQA